MKTDELHGTARQYDQAFNVTITDGSPNLQRHKQADLGTAM